MKTPPAAKVGAAMGLLIATLGASISMAPLEVFASGLALSAIFLLLWRSSDPPVLLLPPLFQWTEVAIVPISTIWKRESLNDLSPSGSNLEVAALFGLAAIVCLAIGLRLAMGRPRGVSQKMREEVQSIRFEPLFRVSIGLMIGGYVVAALLPFSGPAREVINHVGNLKYVGFFMLAFWCLVRRQRMEILGVVVAFEIISGMTGFFAEFKDALLALIVAALAARPKLRVNDTFVISAAATLLLFVAIFWSAVKPAYRAFVNQGTGAQVVLVPVSDRVDFLAGELAVFDGVSVSQGFDTLVARHGYIEYLARTMEFVPQGLPHENGALTVAVLKHISVPRFLNPGKPPLPSDTEVMAKYTGQANVWDSNTSISLGHLAELYVDFGHFGALLGMLVIGAMLGSVYRILISSRHTPAIMAAGLSLVAALPVAYFGTAYVKLVGAMVFASAVCILVQRVGGPFVARQLMRPAPTRRG
jgi:hypothetical protein